MINKLNKTTLDQLRALDMNGQSCLKLRTKLKQQKYGIIGQLDVT